ncbi:uncharacterized protein LOC113037838 [Carassius auratus]|uniref:non-specific serine/threonine protein kinase n=1 Tax=Carassius auratus TaxID=7957 RepID=A0A6P6IT46_CARAU|nr:uncharacterized protein LOC113037838 [Carassius auratus]
MGLLSKALNRLRTLLKRTPQPHPDQDNETPVGACVADVGGGSEAGKEKNKRERKRFWRWHLRRKKYSVAKAEKLYQTSVLGTGTYRRHSQSLKELTPTAEYTEDVLQPAVLDISVCSSAGKGTDSPVHLSDDDSFVSAVTSIAHSAIACAVADEDIASAVADEDIASAESLIHQDINSAVRPKAERDVASVQHSKIDGGIALAVLPKEDGGIASARHPQVDMGIASAVCTPVDSGATGELDKDHICWRYKFGGRLGEGGFGSVRKGTRVKDGLKVAVKYVKKTKHTKYITTVSMLLLLIHCLSSHNTVSY